MSTDVDRWVSAGERAVTRSREKQAPIFEKVSAARSSQRVAALVPVLRERWRKEHPDDEGGMAENVFLTAALRAAGAPAALRLGREAAPPARAAHYLSWVECDGQVVSTGAPVQELYEVVLSLPG